MAASEQSTTRCVGALLYDDEGRLLLIRRGQHPGRGLWSVPGGRVEPGETDAAALVREIAEETGLTVTVTRLCGIVTRPAPDGIFAIHDYHCEVIAGRPRAGSDATDVRWVDAATFAALDRAGELVDQLADTLRGWHALPRR